jgi:hypothetical protein
MERMNMKYTLGTDPEFMLVDRNGSIVSAIPVIQRDKHDPIVLGEDGVKVYFDNTMIETNTVPADSRATFVDNIRDTFQRIQGVLGTDYDFVAVPSNYFSVVECMHPDAMIAGCNPEFCAKLAEACFPPDFTDTFRSAGGHIHIGRTDFVDFDEDDAEDNGEFLLAHESKRKMIRAMDIFVGCPLTLIDDSAASAARKRLYGKASRFRPTAYGVEYRTPSNYWLSSPVMAELIWDLTMAALEACKDDKIEAVDFDRAFESINDNDAKGATAIIDKYLTPELKERVNALRGAKYDTIRKEWSI